MIRTHYVVAEELAHEIHPAAPQVCLQWMFSTFKPEFLASMVTEDPDVRKAIGRLYESAVLDRSYKADHGYLA